MTYQAKYGSVTLEGDFGEVGDILAQRGFDLTSAEQVKPNVMLVPHTLAHRTPAKVQKLKEKKRKKSPEILSMEHTYRATMLGARAPGLKTRECGSVHPDGLCCMIPVLYQPLCPHCETDRVFGHDGPHEAILEGVVVLRWLETVEIEDVSYNAYGPVTDG